MGRGSGRGSGRGDGRGAAKVMKITPAGKVCVASSLLLFVYFLWRLSNSRLFKVFWIMLESNEGNTMSMSGYHTHKEMMKPEMAFSKEQRVHRMEIIRAHQNHARLQAESLVKGGGGINLAGHPWVLYNGLYTPSGFEVEGFPVYNNSHGKWMFHPLPTAWDSEEPQKEAEGWDAGLKCPEFAQGEGGMCVCLNGYYGEMMYNDETETFSGTCERTPSDMWMVHNSYTDYVERGDVSNDGQLLGTDGSIPLGLNAWSYWTGRENSMVSWETKYIWPNTPEWSAMLAAQSKFRHGEANKGFKTAAADTGGR